MRVLTVVDYLGVGGTQRAAVNYSVGYRRSGHEVAVLAYWAGGAREGELRRAGIPVFVGGPEDRSKAAAVAAAEAFGPDLIHVHRKAPENCPLVVPLAALRHSGRAVIETNVFSRVDFSEHRHLIDVHLQLSRWCLWKWRSWARGLDPMPLACVIPYIVDTEAFAPAGSDGRQRWRERWGIPREAIVFGRVGQPIASKWSACIFPAFVALARRREDVHLALLGLPDALEPLVERMPAALRRRVLRFPPTASDAELREFYWGLDVFLHAAAIGESFGMVLGEAMACGVPVITLSTPAKDNTQIELVGHEVAGLVVHRPSGLLAAMRRLAEDRPLRERLGRQGRARIEAHYAAGPVMRQLDDLLGIVSSTPRGRLADALSALPGATSLAEDDAWVAALLEQGADAALWTSRWLMRLVHEPRVYRLYRALSRHR